MTDTMNPSTMSPAATTSEAAAPATGAADHLRHDWTADEVTALFELPLTDLLWRAQSTHRRHREPDAVQLSTLLSIKTGACPEDCAYCPQAAQYNTGLKPEPLMDTEKVLTAARRAKEAGAQRFCMGAAWRSPKDRDIERVSAMIEGVKALGLETCMTLGMLSDDHAEALANAGLDYYNHNLDTSAEYYEEIITTRTYGDRLDTLDAVRSAGMKVCCGGIVGMGETRADRVGLLMTLANLAHHPESVPINELVQVPGTPLADGETLDPFEFVRTVAVARLMMPDSAVRLSAGRTEMSDELQALCFTAGADSIFYGEKLLTTDNPEGNTDRELLDRIGLRAGLTES
ncbi:MAG: biotin synthase BioB [Candidatus Microthrix subdominans]|nr:biotin synthase BioB [Candidatus Microthrix sp.]HMS46584.1 biotin synthase BioB [Candidatus Microthrix sp.]